MNRFISFLTLLLFLVSNTPIFSQQSSEILLELQRLKSPYRLLYLAAHPDDENTRLISYFTGEEKVRTAYLSLTRGAGGQNLIGPEKGPLLGLLRTEELLAARRMDGGEQFFTRAIDFGYSKTSKESLEFWGRSELLEDVLFIIRYYKPHVIINRFPSSDYAGHGHHHVSALISADAFEKSGNPDVYVDQVAQLGIWNVGSLYFNSSSWWDKSLPERAKNDALIKQINVGKYNALMGYSPNELSAHSRSQHKSQGFGSATQKGDQFEYIEHLSGLHNKELFTEHLLDSIDQKWLELGSTFDSLIKNFNAFRPDQTAAGLLQIRKRVIALSIENERFNSKLEQLNELIASCLGMSLELVSKRDYYVRNDEATINTQILNRSSYEVRLLDIKYKDLLFSWNRKLLNNEIFEDTLSFTFDSADAYSNPYWLKNTGKFRYQHDIELLRKPGADAHVSSATIRLIIAGDTISFIRPMVYRWTDRVKGGLEKPIRLLPEITMKFDKQIYFLEDSSIRGNIILKLHKGKKMDGVLKITGDSSLSSLNLGKFTFSTTKTVVSIPFEYKLDFKTLKNQQMKLSFVTETDSFNLSRFDVEYDHIHSQMALLPCEAKIVPIHFNQLPGKIAYVEGPDNEMIHYLKDAGCDITSFTEEDVIAGKLAEYEVLLFGIRSINVNKNWKKYKDQILNFTKKGGTTIVLYQTSRGINPLDISPYSFEISRKRVTDEKAKTKILKPEHPIVNYPFKLSSSDFENWNQERGLYFAGQRDESFQVIFSWHDPDELDEFGSLIVGDYGKGAFIYTGISFFRHIPAAVPGSYKLMMNVLSYKPQ